MANPSKTIDLFAQRIEGAFASVRDNLADVVEQLAKAGTSHEQIVSALVDPSLRADLGIDRDSIVKLFDETAVKILAANPSGAITPEMLDALTTISKESFIAHADQYWATIQRELTSSVLSGNTKGLRDVLRNTDGLISYQAEALFNTTLNTYSRSVGASVAANDKPETKYVYEGPVVGARDICLKMMAAGAITRAEINAMFLGSFIDGGGYNCRHQWVPVRAAFDVNTKKAKELANAKIKLREAKGKTWNPLTPRQIIEARDG